MFKKFILLVIIVTPLLTGCVAAVATGAVVGTDMANDRRSTGIYIEDQNIELKAAKSLGKVAAIKDRTSIGITSYNRIVLLTGQAPTEQLRSQASELVRKVDNIRKIHNEIRISAPDSFLSTTSDSWITTKAKSLMLAEKAFESRHIKVVTENGELFLMGIVKRTEAEKAIAIVREIDGVERVIEVFEYLP